MPFIQLVEDNPADETLTLHALSKQSPAPRVVVAHDGAEAVAQLHGRADAELPALVLLDLHMPKMDGIEVLRRIRAHERTRFLPVLLLTSSSAERDRLACYEAGCNGYVCKPVGLREFAEAMQHVVGYWLIVNQRAPES